MGASVGAKLLIHQSELRTYTKAIPFKEKSSFRFVVLWKILNGMEYLTLINIFIKVNCITWFVLTRDCIY